MKITIIFLLLIILQSIRLQCDLTTCINYSHNPIEESLLASIDFGRRTTVGSYGVYDGFRKFDLASGIRIVNSNIIYAYDFSIFSYLALVRIPLNQGIWNPDDPNFKYDFDDHDLNDGPAYLTFSYKGPQLSNLGIYKKDYNWSSAGIDFLYKNFNWNEFYTRFSYIVTVSTIQNNMNYFADIDITNKSKLCLDMKISNSTNVFFTDKNWSELKLESYYRMIFNDSKQKEIGVNLKYEYQAWFPFFINSQIGYIRYGANDNWKNLFKIGIGMSFAILQGPY